MAKVRITGKSGGSCGSGSSSDDAKSTGIQNFSGTVAIDVHAVEGGVPDRMSLIRFDGPVNGKITTGGIELEGNIQDNKGRDKIVRISGKGTSEDEKKKESAKCNPEEGYTWIQSYLDTISITDK
ncbi:hypothetical protein GQ42DRAFT_159691 [Ramicandelaber brevisporus]|nr:hypothetical protein GQ42DRAFT_159691 [Ramicandelaber brevisporus]